MSGQPPSSPAQPGATRAPTPLECNFLIAIVKNSDGVTNVSFIPHSHPLLFLLSPSLLRRRQFIYHQIIAYYHKFTDSNPSYHQPMNSSFTRHMFSFSRYYKHSYAVSLTVPQIDWEAVASEAGYNSAGTARTRFGQVKKALGWTVRCVGSKTSPTKSPTKVEKKPAKPRARKPKAMAKKQEEVYKEALSQAAVDDDSNGYEQDYANDDKQEYGNGYKEELEVVKAEDVDEDGDTLVEEEYASADDYA